MQYEASSSRHLPKIVSEYDQELPQSQFADNPMAPRGRATQVCSNNIAWVKNGPAQGGICFT